MFSFHKPKVYRSINGCCICRAKSSSSRFTDSRRYESDFGKCFEINERRQGEICNACVLLVKRWKKLPAGSTRNWHHVVDARAGPGTKSMNKIKKNSNDDLKYLKRKHRYKPKKQRAGTPSEEAPNVDLFNFDDELEYDDDLGEEESVTTTPVLSDESEEEVEPRDHDDRIHTVPEACQPRDTAERPFARRRRKVAPRLKLSPFLDLTYWKQSKVCCGIVFTGLRGELLLDHALYRPCASHKRQRLNSSSQGSDKNTDSATQSPREQEISLYDDAMQEESAPPSTVDSDADSMCGGDVCDAAGDRCVSQKDPRADEVHSALRSDDLWDSGRARRAVYGGAGATSLDGPAMLDLTLATTGHAPLPPQLASPRCISMEV